jgi:hypothetical protein
MLLILKELMTYTTKGKYAMKNAIKLFILFAIVLGMAGLSDAQITLSTTTLGAAITNTSTNQLNQTITLASTSTMLAAGPSNLVNTALYVDQEFMTVVSVPTSTTVTVRRGVGQGIGSKPTTHLSGATVWFANTSNGIYAMSQFTTNSGPENWGSCVATNIIALPRINTYSGTKSDCLGVGTAGHWVRTDAPGYPVLAATYTVPAGAIVPGGTVIITDTGTAAATSITVPNGWSPGMCLEFIPGGAFTTTTAGNIGNATTAVAGKLLLECWDGTKWAGSY